MRIPTLPKSFFWLWLLCFTFPADASLSEGVSYRSRLWQLGEDHAQNAIQAIAQTADGFLWIGTQNGLARFDGERFEFVPIPSTNASPRRINALCTDDQGRLWIGAAQGLFQLENGAPRAVPIPAKLNGLILALEHYEDGLWIGTGNRLLLFKNEKFTWIPEFNATRFSGKLPAAGDAIRALEMDPNLGLWTAASDMIALLKNEKVSTNYNLAPFKPDAIRALCVARDGSLWIGSTYGLIRFHDGKFTHFGKPEGLPDNNVSALHEDRFGNLWIGTFGGLCRFVRGKFQTEITAEGEPYNLIFCFFEDREENLWIGSKEGLHQLNVQQFTTYTTRHGLAHNNVMSVFEDREATLWIGTWGGGLHRVRDGKLSIFSTQNSKKMLNDMVLGLCSSRDGSLWFGEDYDGGLYRLKDGEFQHFGQEQGVSRSGIRALLEDSTGRLLIGHASGGLGYFFKGKVHFWSTKHGLPGGSLRCLIESQDGNFWIGTETGLVHWNNKVFKTFTTKDGLSDKTVLSVYEDKERNLWIGTANGGLNRFREGRFTFYNSQRGLFDNNILEILEDDFGNLWLASRAGVSRVSKKEFDDFDAGKIKKISGTVFGKADGMSSQVCVGVAKPSAFKSRDGRLWFATTKGVAVTDPKLQLGKNEKPPSVVIRTVMADKKNVTSDTWQATGTGSNPVTRHISPGRGDLEFHYNALSFTAPEKNRFKYKLEGLDADWVDAGTRRIAFYNNTPPGNYTFRVIACNNDGVWNQLGANVKFTLKPHLWQTWAFKISLAAASLFLAAAAARYFTKARMQQKLLRLEHQHAIEKERSRIAQDMHDDLGARLTEILLVNDQVKKCKDNPNQVEANITKSSQSVSEVVDNLHGIVWAVNPRNDSLEKLAGYIYQYVQTFLESGSIRYRFDAPEDLPDLPLSSEIRHHVFMVVKESLNNIAKHAGATEVWIRLAVSNATFSITIEDNGKGFSLDGTSARGNGLLNMDKRMKSINGAFCLASDPGKGTRIQLKIPLPRI